MKFINLNQKLATQSQHKSSKKNLWVKVLGIVMLVVLIFGGISYFAIRDIYASLRELKYTGANLAVAVRNENLDQIDQEIKKAQGSVQKLNRSLNLMFWVRLIPIVGDYYHDGIKFARAAEYELKAASLIVQVLRPYKNELGLIGNPIPGQDRISQGLKILEKIIPILDQLEPIFRTASDQVREINIDKYPEKLGNMNLRHNIQLAKEMIIGAHLAVTKARPAIEVAPLALGQPNPKTYLLIFQNDKELRATGGFMTAYAFIKLDKGRLSASSSDDIYNLDERLLRVCLNKICPLTPPEPIVKYLPEPDGKPRKAWSLRDSNLSPDVPTSMRQFEQMYQLLGEGLPFDGIILIDTYVVEELIKFTGPIEVFGTTFSAEKDERCNCPNVIFELEHYAQVVERGEADRKAILGTLMQQILARALGASSENIPELINVGVKLANEKHIIFYMHDQRVQNALSQLNWTGEIVNSPGDYLHINDSNFAGGKSNLYVQQEVMLEVEQRGKMLINRLTINYKNPQPFNIWLNGINRDYVRVYVPKGSKLISSKGSEVQVSTKEDLGKTMFEAFIRVRPQNSTTLQFEYSLPITEQEYLLLIQKQPGKPSFPYKIKVNGRVVTEFGLNSDQQIKIKL